MTYRDEREALHARVEALQQELADVQRRLGDLRPDASPPDPAQDPARRGSAGAPPPAATGGPGADLGRLLFAVPPLAVATALTLAGLCRLGADPSRLGMSAAGHEAAATWRATVTRADGHVLAPGTACEVTGTFRSDGASPADARVDITCGGAVLYTWDAVQVGGTTMRQCSVWEGPETLGGARRHRLQCQDVGPREGGRPRLELDTVARRAVVSHDAAPAFRVELALAELSAPRFGPALYAPAAPETPAFHPVLRTGRVVAVSDPGVAKDATCSVWVMPVPHPYYNCRVEVRCGDARPYGAPHAGYARCDAAGGLVVRAVDAEGSRGDGDPRLDLDFVHERVTVSDDLARGLASVTVALDPRTPPGVAVDDDGHARLVDFEVERGCPVLRALAEARDAERAAHGARDAE